MTHEVIRLYPRYSLDRDTVSGRAVLAIDWDRGACSGELYYRISEDELAHFLADDNALEAFVSRAEGGHLEDRRVGSNGLPLLP